MTNVIINYYYKYLSGLKVIDPGKDMLGEMSEDAYTPDAAAETVRNFMLSE